MDPCERGAAPGEAHRELPGQPYVERNARGCSQGHGYIQRLHGCVICHRPECHGAADGCGSADHSIGRAWPNGDGCWCQRTNEESDRSGNIHLKVECCWKPNSDDKAGASSVADRDIGPDGDAFVQRQRELQRPRGCGADGARRVLPVQQQFLRIGHPEGQGKSDELCKRCCSRSGSYLCTESGDEFPGSDAAVIRHDGRLSSTGKGTRISTNWATGCPDRVISTAC